MLEVQAANCDLSCNSAVQNIINCVILHCLMRESDRARKDQETCPKFLPSNNDKLRRNKT